MHQFLQIYWGEFINKLQVFQVFLVNPPLHEYDIQTNKIKFKLLVRLNLANDFP